MILVAAVALVSLVYVASVRAAASADGGAKQCTNAQGVTRPCAPGNDQCNASQPPPLPRYHVVDYSCGENDPNGPCYDPKHKVYHVGVAWSRTLAFLVALKLPLTKSLPVALLSGSPGYWRWNHMGPCRFEGPRKVGSGRRRPVERCALGQCCRIFWLLHERCPWPHDLDISRRVH